MRTKYTPSYVRRINWKKKTTKEVLKACEEKWMEVLSKVAEGKTYEQVECHTDSCPACQKWLDGMSCAKCPLAGRTHTSSTCCSNMWRKFNTNLALRKQRLTRAYAGAIVEIIRFEIEKIPS